MLRCIWWTTRFISQIITSQSLYLPGLNSVCVCVCAGAAAPHGSCVWTWSLDSLESDQTRCFNSCVLKTRLFGLNVWMYSCVFLVSGSTREPCCVQVRFTLTSRTVGTRPTHHTTWSASGRCVHREHVDVCWGVWVNKRWIPGISRRPPSPPAHKQWRPHALANVTFSVAASWLRFRLRWNFTSLERSRRSNWICTGRFPQSSRADPPLDGLLLVCPAGHRLASR